ncbi:MAG: ORF6N domain-containing protein [Acholeplasmatales bacterium]|nr:ORF6N domain-containing protein [Acholeplasmatales bacterium]
MIENELIIPELNNETIESMIYIIRGKKVMLDFELAKIYGYETKNFNRQVKNNIDKFDRDFRFQLNKEEYDIVLKCKNFTSSWGGNRKSPYAFTEQGIYMLMTVLKGDLATRQSKALIRAFKQMKDYIVENNNLSLNTNSYIESKFSACDKRFESIENKLEMVEMIKC